jgi:ABC-type transporter Mla maintaining outer membrane lipid asymmetry permease subunit MlaE
MGTYYGLFHSRGSQRRAQNQADRFNLLPGPLLRVVWRSGLLLLPVGPSRLPPPYEAREFAHQLDELGSKSLPLVALAGAATGVVLSLETRDSLVSFGAKSLLPALLVVSIIKESGPIITGLIVSGRVAAGIGAELGAMKVTEQIDAMEASAVDPYK